MHGHQWLPAEGTIVDVEPAHGRHEHHYSIQIRKPDGVLIRRTIKHKDQVPYQVGSKVRAEISDTNEIRFDPNYTGEASIIATMDMTDQIREASEAFDSPGARGPQFGTRVNIAGANVFVASADAKVALAAMFDSVGLANGATVSAIGPDGQPLQADPAELAHLAQVVLSGDPAARQAAAERLKQIGYSAPPADNPT
jgi:hypothetical protein